VRVSKKIGTKKFPKNTRYKRGEIYKMQTLISAIQKLVFRGLVGYVDKKIGASREVAEG